MLLTDSEGKARDRRVQAIVAAGLRRRNRLGLLAGVAAPLLLAGCSDVPNRINPVSWWHEMEGGAIAQNRPPPPNPHAPFPMIANQPARPAGMPDWEWQQLSGALAAQRASAQAYAAQNPIRALPQAPATRPGAAPRVVEAAVPAPVPSPAAAAPAQAAAEDHGGSSAAAAEIARLAAAPGPAGAQADLPTTAMATATANAKAAGSGGHAADTGISSLTFNGPTARPSTTGPRTVPIEAGSPDPGGPAAGTNITYFDPSNGLSIPGALAPAEPVDEAHAPPVPASVPAPPALPGFAIPTVPATYVPPKPVPQPAPYVPPAPLPAVGPVPIQFAPRSAVLTPPMQRALRNLNIASKGARFDVIGFGDAASDSIADQAAAMPLALERARAITVQLMANGVPPRRLTTGARALGSGGLARLAE